MLTRNRAYEVHKGETQKLFDTWMKKCKKLIVKNVQIKHLKKVFMT